MAYIIASRSEDNRFLCRDRNGRFSVVNRPEKAFRFEDAGTAWKTITTQIPKKKRDGWYVVPHETDHDKKKEKTAYRAELDMKDIADEVFDWDKVRTCITESFAEIIAYKERLRAKLDVVEAELCDCEHACEFFKCDAAHGYKLYAMIRERRIKRRHLKDELRKANAVLDMSYTDIAGGGIESSFKEIESQIYTPRVLTELFWDVVSHDTK